MLNNGKEGTKENRSSSNLKERLNILEHIPTHLAVLLHTNHAFIKPNSTAIVLNLHDLCPDGIRQGSLQN